jgi:hypothetical protein
LAGEKEEFSEEQRGGVVGAGWLICDPLTIPLGIVDSLGLLNPDTDWLEQWNYHAAVFLN